MSVNLASKYAKQVDERFYKASQAQLALNNNYKFTGVKTVNVYSIPTVALTNYTRSGTNRYGSPTELQDSVQELTVTRDRAYAFTIDKGNKVQQEMIKDAGQAYARELREVVIPEFDRYVFWTLASAAYGNSPDSGTTRPYTATTAATKSNAYELFLSAQEKLGDACVPDSGRVCFCSYAFANLLKQDPAFMKEGDRSKSMIDRGVLGEVDGTRIVKVPASRLPTGAAFILTHPIAACAPKQLWEHKIHTDPPGISGWLVEGRVLYDCFVLNEKKNAIFYHGTAPAGTFS